MSISVIVPIYNTACYIERCVDSLCKQSYSDLEIILINDGSEDESLSVIRKLEKEDARIRVVDKEHSGLSATRNAGLQIMTGDYVSFIDSDDWVSTDMYETMMKQIEETGADAAYCEWTEEYSDGSRDIKSYHGRKKVVLKGDNIVEGFYKKGVHLRISSGLICTAIVKDLFFDTNLQPGEETYFGFRALCNAKCIVYSDNPFYHRYHRVGSISNQKCFNETELRRALSTDMMLDYIKKNKPQHLSRAFNHTFKYYETVLNYLLYFDGEQQFHPIYEQITKRLKELYNEMEHPWIWLEFPVLMAYLAFNANKTIYNLIVKIYYKKIKKQFDSKRQQ